VIGAGEFRLSPAEIAAIDHFQADVAP